MATAHKGHISGSLMWPLYTGLTVLLFFYFLNPPLDLNFAFWSNILC